MSLGFKKKIRVFFGFFSSFFRQKTECQYELFLQTTLLVCGFSAKEVPTKQMCCVSVAHLVSLGYVSHLLRHGLLLENMGTGHSCEETT
jgi:hypothetical protein